MTIPLARKSKETIEDVADFILQLFEDSYTHEKINNKIHKAIELGDITERINEEGQFGYMKQGTVPIHLNNKQVGIIIKRYLKDKVGRLKTSRNGKHKHFIYLRESLEILH